jgi:hypothetical protein
MNIAVAVKVRIASLGELLPRWGVNPMIGKQIRPAQRAHIARCPGRCPGGCLIPDILVHSGPPHVANSLSHEAL